MYYNESQKVHAIQKQTVKDIPRLSNFLTHKAEEDNIKF